MLSKLLGGLALALWVTFAHAASMVVLPQQLVVDSDGDPRSGARLYVYEAGTTTPLTTYTTPALSATHSNPIESTASGLFPAIYVAPSVTAYKLVLKDSSDVTIYTEDNIPAAVFTQAQIAETLYPANDAEDNAGVTPSNFACYYGTPCRYGIDDDGTTNYTSELADMFAVGGQGQALDFGSNLTIVTDPFTINAANSNIPPSITGYGITLKGRTGCAGPLVTIENPQTDYEGFKWEGSFTFDANGLCTSGLLIHGSQRASYSGFRAINAVGGPQIRIEGESGFGVFYNVFDHFIAGGSQSQGGDDDGFSCKSTDGSNRISSNTWIAPKSSWNVGKGYDLDRCNDLFLGLEAEKNDGDGVAVDNAASIDFIGGYTEHNNQSFSGDDTTDGTTDVSFSFTANTGQPRVIGGNHNGTVDAGSAIRPVLLPGSASGTTITQDSIAFSGASATANSINGVNTSDFLLRVSGATKWKWESSTDNMEALVPVAGTSFLPSKVNVASTTNITYVSTGDVWRITGNTTINTITAPTVGSPCIRLYFVSNPTVNDDSTSSGNIKLAGGSNFSASADDMLHLCYISDASAWIEQARSVN